jgi:hypothetical protein
MPVTPTQKVLAALENPEYTWRTIPGIVTDTGLSQEEVEQSLHELMGSGQVIQSEVSSEDGRDLFATYPKVVVEALENPDYEWRTIPGIAAETGLPPDRVTQILEQLIAKRLVISSSDTEGRKLFTTRPHFREKAPLWEKFVAAIKNRAD